MIKSVKCMLAAIMPGLLITGMLFFCYVSVNAEVYYVAENVDRELEKVKLKKLQSKAALVMDVDSGRIILGRNINKRESIASLTKIMTMYLIMEQIESGKLSFDDKIVVPESAYGLVNQSQVWLAPGERFTVREYLESIAVQSANDSCITMAEHIAGSQNGFVKMMNKKAVELGLKNTRFKDVDGMKNKKDGHYSTAKDMVKLSYELIGRYPDILNFTKIWQKDFRPDGPVIKMQNTNALVHYYKGVIGLKTGYTSAAGYNLITYAEKNGKRLLTVLLGGPTTAIRFAETIKMLDEAFINYNDRVVAKAGDSAGTINLPEGNLTEMEAFYPEDIKIFLKKSEVGKITSDFIPSEVSLPLTAGTVVGRVEFRLNDRTLKTADVAVNADNKEASWWTKFCRWVVSLFNFR